MNDDELDDTLLFVIKRSGELRSLASIPAATGVSIESLSAAVMVNASAHGEDDYDLVVSRVTSSVGRLLDNRSIAAYEAIDDLGNQTTCFRAISILEGLGMEADDS